jgi:hypothetical protein
MHLFVFHYSSPYISENYRWNLRLSFASVLYIRLQVGIRQSVIPLRSGGYDEETRRVVVAFT